jgi:predicted kinase
MVREDEEYFCREKEVFEQYILQISNALSNNKIVIANATQANYGSRKKLLHAVDEKFGRDYNIVMYCIICNYETADRRNKQRKGRAVVPSKAMMEMFNNFSVPNLKEDDRIEKIIIECYGACSIMRRQKI